METEFKASVLIRLFVFEDDGKGVWFTNGPYLGWRDLYDRVGATDLFRSFARATGVSVSPRSVRMSPATYSVVAAGIKEVLMVYKPRRGKGGKLRPRWRRIPEHRKNVVEWKFCSEYADYGPTLDETIPYGAIKIELPGDGTFQAPVSNEKEVK